MSNAIFPSISLKLYSSPPPLPLLLQIFPSVVSQVINFRIPA